jgi:hypothetical protein
MGIGLQASAFQSIIQRATSKVLGVAISPKEFRHMYVTYIMNRKDLTENERRAVAWAMGHSLDMQEGTYDKTSSDAYRRTVKDCHQAPETWDSQQEAA